MKSNLSALQSQLCEDDLPQPDGKPEIAEKIRTRHIVESDRIEFTIYHVTAYDQDLMIDIRAIIHDIFDDMGLVDIEVIGKPHHIRIDDKKHYDGEVYVSVIRKHQEDDISFK